MIKNIYPIVITSHLTQVREFYTQILDFHVVYESEWYIQLESQSNQLAFMLPGLENQPEELRKEYSGHGLVITLEVIDVDKVYEAKHSKLKIIAELKTEAWGQKHFIVEDPAGMMIDIVEYTSPEDYK